MMCPQRQVLHSGSFPTGVPLRTPFVLIGDQSSLVLSSLPMKMRPGNGRTRLEGSNLHAQTCNAWACLPEKYPYPSPLAKTDAGRTGSNGGRLRVDEAVIYPTQRFGDRKLN